MLSLVLENLKELSERALGFTFFLLWNLMEEIKSNNNWTKIQLTDRPTRSYSNIPNFFRPISFHLSFSISQFFKITKIQLLFLKIASFCLFPLSFPLIWTWPLLNQRPSNSNLTWNLDLLTKNSWFWGRLFMRFCLRKEKRKVFYLWVLVSD